MKNLLFEMYVNNQLKFEKVTAKDTTEESTQLGTNETTELDDGEDNSKSASILGEISQISEFSTETKSDSTIIAGKELDIFGTLPDDDIISTAIKTNLMGLSEDIIKNIKQVIWDLHHKKTDPTPDPTPDPDPTPTPDPNPDPTPTPTPNPPQSEDGTDGKGPDTQLNSVKTLSRGDAAWTSTFNSTEQVLTLKNPFGGANYQYKISSTNGSNVSATFEFLNNGRLVVTGDYLKIEACDNQYDDLIILGNNNNISTGNGSDIVRVGLAIDGYIKENYLKNGSGSYLQTSDGEKIYLTSGNTVNTGSGDDYITMLSFDYNVDMGEGDDKFLVPYLDQIISQNVKNTEMQRLLTSKGYLDGIDGWTNQGTEGDCRLLAIINSFCNNNKKLQGAQQ